MKTTLYFTASVLPRRPYLKTEWIEYVLENSIRTEVQTNGRVRRWAFIPELGKHLRVVTEPTAKRCTMLFQTVALDREDTRS